MAIVTSMLIHFIYLHSLYQNLDTIRRTFVSIDDFSFVEEIVERDIFIYGFDIEEGEYVGKLARRSIGKFEKTMKLSRFNNDMIQMNNIDSFFKYFRCPSCDTSFHKSDHFIKHLIRCKDIVPIFIPKTRTYYGSQYSRNRIVSTFPTLKIRNFLIM